MTPMPNSGRRSHGLQIGLERCRRADPQTTASALRAVFLVSALLMLGCISFDHSSRGTSTTPPFDIRADSAAFGATVFRQGARVKITAVITNRSSRPIYIPCQSPMASVLYSLEKLVDGVWRRVFSEPSFLEPRRACRIAPGKSYRDTANLRGPVVRRGIGSQFSVDSMPGTYRGAYEVFSTKEAAELRAPVGGGAFPHELRTSTPFFIYVNP